MFNYIEKTVDGPFGISSLFSLVVLSNPSNPHSISSIYKGKIQNSANSNVEIS